MDISVIIPAKNRLWALPKAVALCRSESLKMQIIVIDDSSMDGTGEWLKTQPDVMHIQGEGWGKPWGVNKALMLATGKYLRYLDSDDWLNPQANETQFNIAEKEKSDVVVAGYDNHQDDKLVRSQRWVHCDDFIAQQLGECDSSHYSAFLFRREFVQAIPHRTLFPASDFASRDDRCFMLEVALRHPKISVCVTPTLCHRHHSQGRLQFASHLRRDGTHIQQLYIYRQILNLLQQRGELTSRRKKAAAKILWPLAHWIANSHLAEATEVAEWVLKLDPQFQIPEAGLLGIFYRKFGFRRTERLLAIRRAILSSFQKKLVVQSLDLPA